MLLVFIILFIVFAGTAALLYTVNHQNRALPDRPDYGELPREPVTLFTDEAGDNDTQAEQTNRHNAALIERATAGDLTTLNEARGDKQVYQQVLNSLIETCERQSNLSALVGHLAGSDDLRGNVRLAERVIAAWQNAPDRRSTVNMLHVAALADDTVIYHRTVDLAVAAFRQGQIANITTGDFLTLIESQYWVLATAARRGGADFAMKQRLAEARRELAAMAPVKQ